METHFTNSQAPKIASLLASIMNAINFSPTQIGKISKFINSDFFIQKYGTREFQSADEISAVFSGVLDSVKKESIRGQKNKVLQIDLSELISVLVFIKCKNFYRTEVEIKFTSKFLSSSYYGLRYSDLNDRAVDKVEHFWEIGYFEGRHPKSNLTPKSKYSCYLAIIDDLKNEKPNSDFIEKFLFDVTPLTLDELT
jgi:hypothetical protein